MNGRGASQGQSDQKPLPAMPKATQFSFAVLGSVGYQLKCRASMHYTQRWAVALMTCLLSCWELTNCWSVNNCSTKTTLLSGKQQVQNIFWNLRAKRQNLTNTSTYLTQVATSPLVQRHVPRTLVSFNPISTFWIEVDSAKPWNWSLNQKTKPAMYSVQQCYSFYLSSM